jgi:CRISPR/Cas system-associated endoribonuclease Cas2
VFQCRIDASLAEKMMARVRHTIEEHTDKVHVVALCESCGERVMTLGVATQASDPEFLIV